MKCPNCGSDFNLGTELAKLARGKPKRFSPEELERRRERLRLGREKRLASLRAAKNAQANGGTPTAEGANSEGTEAIDFGQG